jgi:undecaprenyl-diphosphatase
LLEPTDILFAVLIGFLQGTTEWLPISSKTQIMILVIGLFGFSGNDAYSLGLFIQGGTVGSAIVYFRKEILGMLRRIPLMILQLIHGSLDFSDYYGRLLFNVIITTIITGSVGLPIYRFISNIFSTLNSLFIMIIVGILLIMTGVVTWYRHSYGLNKLENMKVYDAVAVGLTQAFSILPGISRSGITTSMLLWRKMSQEDAFRYSFIVGIPASVGSSFIALFGGSQLFSLGQIDFFTTIIMLMVSFVVGFISIKFLLKIARAMNFATFTIILGLFTISLSLLFYIFI